MATLTFKTEADAPEELRSALIKGENGFTIDVAPSALVEQIRVRAEAEADARNLKKTADDLTAKLGPLEKAVADAKANANGDVESRVKARIAELEAATEGRITTLTATLAERDKAVAELTAARDSSVMRMALNEALGPLVGSLNPQAIGLVTDTLAKSLAFRDGAVVVVDGKGNTRFGTDAATPLSVATFVKGMIDGELSFTKRANPGSGTGANGVKAPVNASPADLVRAAHGLT